MSVQELNVLETPFISVGDLEQQASDLSAALHFAYDLEWPEPPTHSQRLGFLCSSDRAMCAFVGHELVDCSYGGPDSGNMDHYCARCGEYWSVPLY